MFVSPAILTFSRQLKYIGKTAGPSVAVAEEAGREALQCETRERELAQMKSTGSFVWGEALSYLFLVGRSSRLRRLPLRLIRRGGKRMVKY